MHRMTLKKISLSEHNLNTETRISPKQLTLDTGDDYSEKMIIRKAVGCLFVQSHAKANASPSQMRQQIER